MQNPFIYLRVLRNADHTVFVVDKGQKTYYHPQFNRSLPFSSGQQVKRSIIEAMMANLGQELPSPVVFFHEISKAKKLEQKEIHGACDPTFADQLIGGWMKAGSDVKTIKRRSPLSISAMHALHPLLAGKTEEAGVFDLRGRQNASVVVKMDNRVLSEEEIEAFLKDAKQLNPNFLNKRIDAFDRATGLFVSDVAIDMRTLFSVSIEPYEPEISPEIQGKLREAGWKEGKNAFGRCLICPLERREQVIAALCNALFNWRITTNQARTFSMNEVLAIAISPSAHKVSGAIRAQLREDATNAARPVVDEKAGAKIFIALPCEGFVPEVVGSADAIEQAEAHLVSLLSNFDYENQV